MQHLTLPEAYGNDPEPTWDGFSMFWFDSLEGAFGGPEMSQSDQNLLREAVGPDDRQLFDRLPGWPLHQKRASVFTTERVILEGKTEPEMVKVLFGVSRMPGLSHDEFFGHWHEVHSQLVTKTPGVRRYVQNHLIMETLARFATTHDGFSEIWFDDLPSLQAAMKSPEWSKVREDGASLFAHPISVVVARERIQKEFNTPLKKPDVASMSDDQIRSTLQAQGFRTLADDPSIVGKIRTAAAGGDLLVWSSDHLVTRVNDHVDVDARSTP